MSNERIETLLSAAVRMMQQQGISQPAPAPQQTPAPTQHVPGITFYNPAGVQQAQGQAPNLEALSPPIGQQQGQVQPPPVPAAQPAERAATAPVFPSFPQAQAMLPNPPVGAVPLSYDQLGQMTPEQINANWSQVKALIDTNPPDIGPAAQWSKVMAVSSTIPNIWSARITHFLTRFSAFIPNATREWEGDASVGNVVKVPSMDRGVTIFDYSRTADLTAPEDIDTSTQDLNINQAKAFNFFLEDLDSVQNRIPGSTLIDNKAQGGAIAIAESIDNYVAGLLRATAEASLAHSSAEATFNLNYLSTVREEAIKINQPRGMLVQIVTPELLKKIDDAAIAKTYGDIVASQLIAGSLSDDGVENAGYVGMIGGVRTYVSNSKSLRGSGSAGTAAAPANNRGDSSLVYVWDMRDLALVVQVNKTESYRLEKRFATGVKGLVNYGAKVLNAGRMQRYVFSD